MWRLRQSPWPRYVIGRQDSLAYQDQKSVSVSFFDQLGRVRRAKVATVKPSSDANATDVTVATGILTDTNYYDTQDAVAVSNPYYGGATAAIGGWTVSRQDTVGRPCRVETTSGAAPSLRLCTGPAGADTTGLTTTTYSADTASSWAVRAENGGATVKHVFDGAGRLTSVVEDPAVANKLTRYDYYPDDKLGTVTQPEGCGAAGSKCIRTFQYSSLGQLKSATNPESGTITYSYNDAGDLFQRVDAVGVTTSHYYDALRRVTRKTYTGGRPSPVIFCYDGIGDGTNCPTISGSNVKTRLTKTVSPASSTTYSSYDVLGRVLSQTQTTGGLTYSLAYTWAPGGKVKTQQYPTGELIQTSYDDAGRITKVDNITPGREKTYANITAYAAHGAIQTMTLGSSTVENWGYNSRLQPKSLIVTVSSSGTTPLQLSWWYCGGQADSCSTNNGNVQAQQMKRDADVNVTQSYTYDAFNRLKSMSESALSQNFTYDAIGNLTVAGGIFNASLTPQNLTEYQNAQNRWKPATGIDYDASGNLTIQPNGATYTYDGENRVATSTQPNTGAISYDYDADGRRVRKTIAAYGSLPQSTTIYVYDALGQLASEFNTGAAPTDSGTSYLTTDALGSTRALWDSAGAAKKCYDYLPFGVEIPQGYRNNKACFGSQGGYPSQNDIVAQKFTGKERDAETGLDYFEARYYSSSTGRFTSPDEFSGGIVDVLTGQEIENDSAVPYADIADPQTLNKYTYVRNNPLRFADPTGHCPWCVAAFVGGGVGGAIGGGIEVGKELYKAYKNGQPVQLDSQKILAKAANGAIFGGTVAATGGLNLLATAGAYTTASVVGGAVERGIDGDSKTAVLDKKAVAADVLIGAATGIIGGAVKDVARNTIAAESKQATTRADSLLRQAIESGDPGKIAKREAQARAVQSNINTQAVAASATQRTVVKTALGTVLKPKEQP